MMIAVRSFLASSVQNGSPPALSAGRRMYARFCTSGSMFLPLRTLSSGL